MPRLLLFVVAVLLVAAVTSPSLEAAPPNIVLIISDDHAWNDYSFLGHEHIKTPQLDRLAAESLVFRHGHVPSSLCRASLMSIFTGLYPHEHRITSNDPPLTVNTVANKSAKKANKQTGRDAEFLRLRGEMNKNVGRVDTMARLLGKAGYQSLQTGKWWEGSWRDGGFTQGMTQGERHGDEGLDIGRKTMQPVYDFIAEATAQQKPFLVWYAPMLPHSPHNPPEKYLAPYRDRAPTDAIARYWACVSWFDETCGELLEHLKEKQLDENTIVVYLADNGWLQDPQADRYLPRSKQSPYEGGLRTPIMIRWPGKIAPRTSEQPVSSLDLLPTLLKAVGLDTPSGLPGLDLLDNSAVTSRDAIFGECFTHNAVDIERPATSLKWRWCIEKNWKLILPNSDNVPDDVVELYDLSVDPWETKNLAAMQPETVAKLRERIDAWWDGMR